MAEAQGGVQAARGELLPKVYVRGVVLRADSTGPLNTFIEGIGIHAEQPIYDGGRYRGEVRRSEAQVSAAYAGLKSITDNVSLQVSLAFEAIDTDRQRIDLGRTLRHSSARKPATDACSLRQGHRNADRHRRRSDRAGPS